MPNNKSKGSKAERELLDIFLESNFRAARVAGSGKKEKSDCDLIAGKSGKKFGIEVKSTKTLYKYISKKQIEDFLVFCEIFGLTPVIAIRFNRFGWYFLNPKDLEDAGKNLGISLEIAKKKGKKFSQFFEDENKSINKEIDILDDINLLEYYEEKKEEIY